MRAKEFIIEAGSWNTKVHGKPGKLHKDLVDTLPTTYVQRQLRNTDPYMQMRYGVALAAALAHKEGAVDFDQETAWAENVTQVLYAPEEAEAVKLASKMMGVKPTQIASNKSREPNHVNNVSPIAKSKKNKYGV
jgi:hypothetical protein